MAISPYVRALRSRIGPARLLLPSVSAHIFDEGGRVLLVRQRDGGVWSTPGGVIEPDEEPADAVVRETWEETGLLVAPTRVLAVFGGPACLVRYPNGDEAQYVITAFVCTVTEGTLRGATEETLDARYFDEAEATAVKLAPWLEAVLPQAYGHDSPGERAAFAPPRWRPSR